MTLTADVAATLQPGFRGTTVPDWLVRAAEGGLVSVCLYGENVAGPEQLAALCALLHERMPAVLLAVDEEGGDVTVAQARQHARATAKGLEAAVSVGEWQHLASQLPEDYADMLGTETVQNH